MGGGTFAVLPSNFLHPLQGGGKGRGGHYPVAIGDCLPALAARIRSSVAREPLPCVALLAVLVRFSYVSHFRYVMYT